MTIKMIVDECDKYELPDITDTFSFNFSTADSWVRSRIVSGREGGGKHIQSMVRKKRKETVFGCVKCSIYLNSQQS
jgi:hypothetical protein